MKPLGPETARLLADLSGLRPAEGERPEERLVRLSQHPEALFADINLRRSPPHAFSGLRDSSRAAVAASLTRVSVAKQGPGHQSPAPVQRVLKSTAPAVTAPNREEEPLSSFTPTSADRREAIEVLQTGRMHSGLCLAALAMAALVLWLLLQFG